MLLVYHAKDPGNTTVNSLEFIEGAHRALLDLRVIPGKWRDHPCLLPGTPVCHLGEQERSWDDPRITGWSSNGHTCFLFFFILKKQIVFIKR